MTSHSVCRLPGGRVGSKPIAGSNKPAVCVSGHSQGFSLLALSVPALPPRPILFNFPT